MRREQSRSSRYTAERGPSGLRRSRKSGNLTAIAISVGLPLHTTNPDDFMGIRGLQVIAVAQPD